jgi:asparagine synthase (glutamine-hydrolysing)
MSAIGGIYQYEGNLVDSNALNALWRALASRAPDGGAKTQVGSIGMAYQAFHTSRESRLEKQPYLLFDGEMLAWDGRLDNRDELVHQLHDSLPDNYVGTTDVAIVMAAYQKWGLDFLSKLIGDFALSFYVPKTKTLLLARDPFGPRPLYYHANKCRIAWSSDLKPLLDFIGATPQINEEYIADYLAAYPDPGSTPYIDIHAVPPGKMIIATDNQLRVKRFWCPDPKLAICYKTDAEYEEHFRHEFYNAVKCRLRADTPVWSELSGGLDSSSIVCMSDQVLNDGTAQTPQLNTVSYVYDESPTSDERSFISSVEEKRRKIGYHLNDDRHFMRFPSLETPLISMPNSFACISGRLEQLLNEMQNHKSRVLLSGNGGDHLLWSGIDFPPNLADYLIQCKLVRLHSYIKSLCVIDKRSYLEFLFKGAILPILPRKMRARYQENTFFGSWLKREFIQRMNLRERSLGPRDDFGFQLPSAKKQSTLLSSIVSHISACYHRDFGCIEVTYPYLHRPLVEFLLAIPFDQKMRPGETRSLHRRSMKHLLPEIILNRKSKGEVSEAVYRGLAREWDNLKPMITKSIMCARGYAEQQSLTSAFYRALQGGEPLSFALLKTFNLEFWLQTEEKRQKARSDEPVAMGAL